MNDKDLEVRKKILKYATALHNACKKSYKENRCNGCPFDVLGGCKLYGHPIEWNDILKSAKQINKE